MVGYNGGCSWSLEAGTEACPSPNLAFQLCPLHRPPLSPSTTFPLSLSSHVTASALTSLSDLNPVHSHQLAQSIGLDFWQRDSACPASPAAFHICWLHIPPCVVSQGMEFLFLGHPEGLAPYPQLSDTESRLVLRIDPSYPRRLSFGICSSKV
jgi:hypothetical protein